MSTKKQPKKQTKADHDRAADHAGTDIDIQERVRAIRTRTTIARTKGGFSHPVEEPVEKTRYEELVDEGVLRPVDTEAPAPSVHRDEEAVKALIDDQKPRAKKAPKEPKIRTPRERKTDLCTFAIRITKEERDEIHAAAGKGGATKFVKAVVLAVARGDAKAIQEHIDRVLGIDPMPAIPRGREVPADGLSQG